MRVSAHRLSIPDGTASVIAEAAAVENRKLRREISCVTGFLVEVHRERRMVVGRAPMSRILRPRIERCSCTINLKSVRQPECECMSHGHWTSLCDTLQMPTPHVAIDDALKKKCSRVALGCVTAEVQAQETPPRLSEELKSREEEILRLPEPRAVLESAPVLATRAGLQGAGKRSRALPRLSGSITAARDRQQRFAADQCGGGRYQPCFRGKPPSGWPL